MNSRHAWLIGLFVLLLALPLLGVSGYRLYQIALVGSTAIIALGLVIVIGIAGQVSLAQAAFSAVGGYGATLFAIHLGISPWIGIPLSAILAGAAGYLLGLGTMRLGGHYLALVTMGLTAIVQVALIHWDSLTGGALGLVVTPLSLGGRDLTSPAQLFYVVIPAAFAMFLIAANLLDSRMGRAFEALRQSEVAAHTLGVNVLHYKALAFAVSAVYGAVGGSLQALQATYLDPNHYSIIYSIVLVAVIVIGGLRSIAGAILGSVVFVFVRESLGAFEFYSGFVFAILLLLVIVLFPSGLAGIGASMAARARPRARQRRPAKVRGAA